MATTLFIEAFPPFSSLTLTLPSETPLADLPSYLPDFIPFFSDTDLAFSLPSGSLPLDSRPLSILWSDSEHHSSGSEDKDGSHHLPSKIITLRLAPRLRGGKGGFGSQLRAAGGRMSSQKTSNNDSCRDLNGRRLSTLKEAKVLATYLESEPERKKAQQEAQRAKLDRLEKRLGINDKGKNKTVTDGEDVAVGTKRRFDDTEYLEQSRDIVDSVKNAVAAGMKKKKKAKTSPSPEPSPDSQGAATSSPSKTTGAASEEPSNADNKPLIDGVAEKPARVTEKVIESPISISTGASVSLATIGA